MKYLIVALVSLVLSGCGYFASETLLPGKRESIFSPSNQSDVIGKAPIAKPVQVKNWLQAGGPASGSFGNINVPLDGMNIAWQASAGAGRPFASPLVIDDQVFLLAGDFTLSAWTIGTGGPRWRLSLAPANEKISKLVGGGIASDGTFIYAITAFGEALKVSIADGKILWRKNLQTALRGAPLVFEGKLVAVSSDGTILALNTENGDTLWQGDGIGESIGLISLNSPVAKGDHIIAALRSGEITSHNKNDGRYLWASGLGRGLPSTTMAVISDIPSRPIIGKTMIFASTVAGETIALDIKSGERIWYQKIGTAVPMSLSGSSLFVLGNNHVMYALDVRNGDIHWSTEIQALEGKHASGFVLANGILWVPTDTSGLVGLNASTGKIIRTHNHKSINAVPPIATTRGLFLYDTSGIIRLLK